MGGAADVGSGASLLDATQPPAPFNAAKDVDDILPGRISHPGVLYQECLGYQQERRQALSAEPLADKVREAHTLATVDRSEAAAFAVERIGASRVDLVVAWAFPNLVVEDHAGGPTNRVPAAGTTPATLALVSGGEAGTSPTGCVLPPNSPPAMICTMPRQQDPQPLGHLMTRPDRQTPWRARYRETGTVGSASGLGIGPGATPAPHQKPAQPSGTLSVAGLTCQSPTELSRALFQEDTS